MFTQPTCFLRLGAGCRDFRGRGRRGHSTRFEPVAGGRRHSVVTGSVGAGEAGPIHIHSNIVALSDGSGISGTTTGSGRAADILLDARGLSVDGRGFPIKPVIESDTAGTASGGTVTVRAGSVNVLGGSEIASSTFGPGNAGKVLIQASSLTIKAGPTNSYFTGVFSRAEPGSTGLGGSVTVRAKNVLVSEGGQIGTTTEGTGGGGSVAVVADNLTIDGSSGVQAAAIANQTYSSGNAGLIRVHAGDLNVVSGGLISNDTFAAGNAGILSITADRIDVAGSAAYLSVVSSEAEQGSTGSAGDVNVRAGACTLVLGGEISSSTFASGFGGDVNVTADSLLLDGLDGDSATGLAAASTATGHAGTVRVATEGNLTIRGKALIEALALQSDGGNVVVAASSLDLLQGLITTSAGRRQHYHRPGIVLGNRARRAN